MTNNIQSMKRVWFLIVILFFGLTTFAQVVDSAHLLINYVPKLANSQKINQQAVIIDTMQEKIEFDYIISPQKMELNFAPAELKAGKLNPEIQERLYRDYIKVGFGYPITPLAELSLHNCQNNKYSYGLFFHHFSSWAEPIGKIQNQFAYAPTSDTRVNLFFNRYFKNYTLYSSVGYNHELANLYGYNKDWCWNPRYYDDTYHDSIRNNFNHVKAEIGFRSNYTTEDKRFKEDVRLNYDFIHTYWKDMEHAVGIHSFLAYDARFLKISGFQHYQLDFNVEYYNNTWNDTVFVGTAHNRPTRKIDNSFKVEFRPMMNFSIKEYHLLVGVGFPIINTNNQTACPIYPVAELQMGLIRGLLSLYVGVDGEAKYNALKELLYENPYLKPQLDSIKFTKTQISLYGGIKGNLVKKLNYHISARYSYSKDMAFFILDTNSLLKNCFDLTYGDVNMLNVCANISWEAIDHLNLTLNANYWGYYFLQHVDKPWYKPTWEIGFDGKYVLKEKFIFDLNAKVAFDRWALVPHAQLRPDPIGEIYYVYTPEKMKKPILNFGIGCEWLITKQFSAFATINNIGCQYASTYYAFNNFGINVLAGVTYSFGNEPLKTPKKAKTTKTAN